MRAKDTVKVYETNSGYPNGLVGSFSQAPYSSRGFDDYLYKGVLYKGFVAVDGSVYIALDQPVLDKQYTGAAR